MWTLLFACMDAQKYGVYEGVMLEARIRFVSEGVGRERCSRTGSSSISLSSEDASLSSSIICFQY